MKLKVRFEERGRGFLARYEWAYEYWHYQSWVDRGCTWFDCTPWLRHHLEK